MAIRINSMYLDNITLIFLEWLDVSLKSNCSEKGQIKNNQCGAVDFMYFVAIVIGSFFLDMQCLQKKGFGATVAPHEVDTP